MCDINLEHSRWLALTSGRDIAKQAAQHLIAMGPISVALPPSNPF